MESLRCSQCSRVVELSVRIQAQLAAHGWVDLVCTGCNARLQLEWLNGSTGMYLRHRAKRGIESAVEETNPRLPDSDDTFEEGVGLNDPRPSKYWNPSPRQIAEWGPIVREETQLLKRESLTAKRGKRQLADDSESAW